MRALTHHSDQIFSKKSIYFYSFSLASFFRFNILWSFKLKKTKMSLIIVRRRWSKSKTSFWITFYSNCNCNFRRNFIWRTFILFWFIKLLFNRLAIYFCNNNGNSNLQIEISTCLDKEKDENEHQMADVC